MILDHLFAPTFRVDPDDSQDPAAQGPEDAERFFTWLRSVYPDLQYTIDDIVVEGEKAVARVHAHERIAGTFSVLGVEYSEMLMLRVAGQQNRGVVDRAESTADPSADRCHPSTVTGGRIAAVPARSRPLQRLT